MESCDFWTRADHSAKVLTRAPTNDFACAGVVRVDRSSLLPWAGAGAIGKTIWGRARTAPVGCVALPPHVTARWAAPPSNSYNAAFIVEASRADQVTTAAVEAVDDLRQYYAAAIPALTLSKRAVDTTL